MTICPSFKLKLSLQVDYLLKRLDGLTQDEIDALSNPRQ